MAWRHLTILEHGSLLTDACGRHWPRDITNRRDETAVHPTGQPATDPSTNSIDLFHSVPMVCVWIWILSACSPLPKEEMLCERKRTIKRSFYRCCYRSPLRLALFYFIFLRDANGKFIYMHEKCEIKTEEITTITSVRREVKYLLCLQCVHRVHRSFVCFVMFSWFFFSSAFYWFWFTEKRNLWPHATTDSNCWAHNTSPVFRPIGLTGRSGESTLMRNEANAAQPPRQHVAMSCTM